MNLFKSLLVPAAVLVGAQAFAGTVYIDDQYRNTGHLSSCGGVVTLSRAWSGKLSLTIVGSRQCSNLEIGGVPYKLDGYQNNYYGTVDLRKEYGTLRASVSSNSGAHSDTIVMQLSGNNGGGNGGGHSDVYLSTNGQRFASLPTCGGTVELNTRGGQVNLVFRDVRQCSNFDILSNDGRSINYPNKKLQGEQGDYNGSFTLPKSVIDFGHNGVRVVVRSNRNRTDDIIYVKFYAF